MSYQIVCADVLAWAAEYEGEPFMACLCDPPYHLKGGFMSKDWDKDGPDAIAFQPETWAAIADHLHPGAFLMAFGGSRTHHRMAIAMEDAGLILHPTMVWLNGQSFPKATQISKQLDDQWAKDNYDGWCECEDCQEGSE
jgi:site-specific DNA-methyltransferase (adenine-specific)